MKKKLFSIMLAAVIMVSMVGCSSSKPENTVNEFLKNSKNFDLAAMNENISPDSQSDSDVVEAVKDNEDLKPYLKFFKKNAQKMTYTIKETNIDEDEATVTVDFKYVDSSDALNAAFTELLKVAFTQAFSGNEMSYEEIEKLITDTLTEYESENSDKFAEKTLDLYCIKVDNKWYIDDFDEEFFDVLLCNYISSLENLDNALDF